MSFFPILSKWIEFLHLLINKLNYLFFDLHFIDNNLQIKFFLEFKYRIFNFSVLCTILLLKSRFTDQSHIYLLFLEVMFPVIEVMKYVVANSLEICKNTCHLCFPWLQDFQRDIDIYHCHATLYNLIYWSQEKMWLKNLFFDKFCKMCLPYFFLLFSSDYGSKKLSNVSMEHL